MAHVESLTAPDIEFGRDLWRSLRSSSQFPIDGMFWLFDSESDEWRLFIATPKVDSIGPRSAYAALSKLTRNVPAPDTQLLRIELMSPKHPLYQALRSVFAKTEAVEGARLGGTQIGGMYVNDAYLYEIR